MDSSNCISDLLKDHVLPCLLRELLMFGSLKIFSSLLYLDR